MMAYRQALPFMQRAASLWFTLPAAARRLSLSLALGLLLAPLAAVGQEVTSALDVEVEPEVFSLCSTSFEAGAVTNPLTSPSTPQLGSSVGFRLRKLSVGDSSETLELRESQFAAFGSETFDPISPTLIEFNSDPAIPANLGNGGEQIFAVSFRPQQAGTYRFGFASAYWDGGFCTVEVTVPEDTGCLVSSAEGIDTEGNPTPGFVDFGAVALGTQATRLIRLNFSRSVSPDESFGFTPFPDPPFGFGSGIEFAPGGESATVDALFEPDSAGDFAQSFEFYAVRESETPECRIPFELRGSGAAPQLTITYEDFECGDPAQVVVVLRNDSSLLLTNLDARATEGFNLSPDPPGSFSGRSFSLGPAGSVDPPSERRFLLRYPLQGPVSEGAEITVSQVADTSSVLSREAIPPVSCIEVVEPSALTINFGDVPVGTAATPGTIRIANRGADPVSVTAQLSDVDQGFGLGADSGPSVTLDIPGQTDAAFDVSFLPATLGQKQTTVNFTSESAEGIPSVDLTGNGIEALEVSLTLLSQGNPVSPGGTVRFPATDVGQSNTLSMALRNDGNLGAEGLAVSASGEFAVVGFSSPQLAAGQSTTFMLRFAPTQAGTRTGQIIITGSNLSSAIQFGVDGEGRLTAISVNPIGLSATVTPAQTPLPTVGLELQGGGAQQTLEGDLVLEFVPSLGSVPTGFLDAYQAVRFATGSAPGRTIAFRIEQNGQRASFPAEQQAGLDAAVARFQSGTVAGSIRFSLANVRTLQGAPVTVTNPAVGTVAINAAAPAIRTTATPQVTGGINVVVNAVTTLREITGVCLGLTPAPGADLSFTRPDPGFLNTPFTAWFGGEASFPHGGAFQLTIPIDISNMQAFGSAQVWLRNAQGWSASNSPCP